MRVQQKVKVITRLVDLVRQKQKEAVLVRLKVLMKVKQKERIIIKLLEIPGVILRVLTRQKIQVKVRQQEPVMVLLQVVSHLQQGKVLEHHGEQIKINQKEEVKQLQKGVTLAKLKEHRQVEHQELR